MSGHVVAENVAKMISLARYKKKKRKKERQAQLSILIIPSRENLFCGRKITSEHFLFVSKQQPKKGLQARGVCRVFPISIT